MCVEVFSISFTAWSCQVDSRIINQDVYILVLPFSLSLLLALWRSTEVAWLWFATDCNKERCLESGVPWLTAAIQRSAPPWPRFRLLTLSGHFFYLFRSIRLHGVLLILCCLDDVGILRKSHQLHRHGIINFSRPSRQLKSDLTH